MVRDSDVRCATQGKNDEEGLNCELLDNTNGKEFTDNYKTCSFSRTQVQYGNLLEAKRDEGELDALKGRGESEVL